MDLYEKAKQNDIVWKRFSALQRDYFTFTSTKTIVLVFHVQLRRCTNYSTSLDYIMLKRIIATSTFHVRVERYFIIPNKNILCRRAFSLHPDENRTDWQKQRNIMQSSLKPNSKNGCSASNSLSLSRFLSLSLSRLSSSYRF